MCTETFPIKSYRLWENVEKYGRAGQATDDNVIPRMRFQCYRHTKTPLLYEIANFWQRVTWTSNLNYYYYYYYYYYYIANCLRPFPACLWFPLHPSLLQPRLSILYVVFLLSFLSIVTVATCFGVFLCIILSAWPYHLSRKAFVNFAASSLCKGTLWRSWFRHFATRRKVAGSIPDEVAEIFHWHNSSGRTMALGVHSAPNRHEQYRYLLG